MVKNFLKEIKKNEPLSKWSGYRTGGNADWFCEAKTRRDLLTVLGRAERDSVPAIVIGSGTNVLFPDAGIRGIVIKNSFSQIRELGDGRIELGSGTTVKEFSSYCIGRSLSGAEFLAGLPGTVGGAMAGNAGACGKSISEIIESASFFSKQKGFFAMSAEEMPFSYRNGFPQKEDPETVSVSIIVRLKESNHAEIIAGMKKAMIPRVSGHPSPLKHTCGCFFKNPKAPDGSQISAGALLDRLGARGMNEGGAFVSDRHCNFIENRGGASSNDIIRLAERLKKLALEKEGIILSNEVRIIPENPPFIPVQI